MTAVRVSELDGMLAPPAPHPQSFLSKSPSRGFCFYNRVQLTRVIDDEARRYPKSMKR
jgi:hypothetical protein